MAPKGKHEFRKERTALPQRKAENFVRVYGEESGRIEEMKTALASLKSKLLDAKKYSKRMELRLLIIEFRKRIIKSHLRIMAGVGKLEGHYIPKVTLAQQIDRITKASKKELIAQAEEIAKHHEKIREN